MQLKNKKILVTGGAGFIGSHVVDYLSKNNEVRVLDDFSVGEEKNLTGSKDRIEIIKGDIRDMPTVEAGVKGMDIVLHMAVRCLRVSINDPFSVNEVNAKGTLNLLEASHKNSVGKFVYVSSSEVYGTVQEEPMNEDHPLNPTTPYGASKLAGELYTTAYYHTYGVPAVTIRPFNTYGPREHLEGESGELIPRVVYKLMKNEPPLIYGSGEQTRDFTYVEDSVKGICAAAESDKIIGDTINIARGEEISVNKIIEIASGILGKEILPKHLDERPGDVLRHFAGVEKAKSALGYTADIGIREGMNKYISWLKEQRIDFDSIKIKDTNW